jgi:hypothetical protein
MARPTLYPDHDTNDANSTATDATIQQNGWPELAQVPNVSWNWLHQYAGKWIRWLDSSTTAVSDVQSAAITATGSEQQFSTGIFTIPANTLTQGTIVRTTYHFRLAGYTAGTVDFKVRGGNTATALGSRPQLGAYQATAPASGVSYVLETEFQVQTAGASLVLLGFCTIKTSEGTPIVTFQDRTNPSLGGQNGTLEYTISATVEFSGGTPNGELWASHIDVLTR